MSLANLYQAFVAKIAIAAVANDSELKNPEPSAQKSERSFSGSDDSDAFATAASATTATNPELAPAEQAAVMRGRHPPNRFSYMAECSHCGPIWHPAPGRLDSCHWCDNRLAGRPIPRSRSVTCGDCHHFRRNGHPHLGHCAVGEPENLAGLWDSDRRSCGRWLPITESYEPTAPAGTPEPAWLQSFEKHLNHIMTCRHCWAPSNRYCTEGARLRDEYHRAYQTN